MVEHAAVNRRVAGSSPAHGAKVFLIYCMPYYLYILKSISHPPYYTGISENPFRRLDFHNTVEKGYTSRYRPWEIVFIKECPGKKEAEILERKIKSWKSRGMIEHVIDGKIIL